MSSGRFAIAAHALALLARAPDGFSSDYLAESINTHRVFLRRILGCLTRAGIVEAREGRSGGYRLARAADRVTLADVYAAVEPDGAVPRSPCEPNSRCVVGAGMRAAFDEAAKAANAGLLEGLATTTVADLAARALKLGKEKPRRQSSTAR